MPARRIVTLRFLFTCTPGLGHFNPLAPLAHALQDAGHAVAFATAPCFTEVVTRAGFECIPAGLDWDERRLLETLPELQAVAATFRGEWIMNHIFLDRSPRRMIADLRRIIPAWRPDLIVSGSFEYGGPLAAEKAGLPYASASYTIRWHPWVLKLATGRAMARLRADCGLPPDRDLKAFARYCDLCFAPPSWRYEDALLRPALTRLVRAKVFGADLPLRQRGLGLRAIVAQRLFARALRRHPEQSLIGPTTHFIGETAYDPDDIPPPPDWLQAMPGQPTVFVSLGTVLSGEYPEIFDKILAALRDQPVNLVITLGGSGDPARFGPQPANVRIAGFMTQPELRALLPHVDLSINHAGYSSVMEALLRGIPLVLLPLVSDAPMNTQMCLVTGVTPELPPGVWGLSPKGLPIIRAEKVTVGIIRDAAMAALREPAYRDAAGRMQQQLADRPGLDAAVQILELTINKIYTLNFINFLQENYYKYRNKY